MAHKSRPHRASVPERLYSAYNKSSQVTRLADKLSYCFLSQTRPYRGSIPRAAHGLEQFTTPTVHIYNTAIVPVFLYGLVTLTDKFLKQIDGQYCRFLRRSIGIKASYYSRTTNREVWIQAGKPVPAQQTLLTCNLTNWLPLGSVAHDST